MPLCRNSLDTLNGTIPLVRDHNKISSFHRIFYDIEKDSGGQDAFTIVIDILFLHRQREKQKKKKTMDPVSIF